MNERLAAPTTRRTVIKTGARLAYAAPLLAASVHFGAGSALATIISPGACFHSSDIPGQGCKETCTATGCSGQACDGCSGGAHPCDACCTAAGLGNVCPSTSYCNPDCFACDVASDVATFTC